jgi:SAM-dependent methyltransferase
MLAEAIARHEAVAECAVTSKDDEPVVFFRLRHRTAPDGDQAASRERLWGRIFDDAYEAGNPADPILNSAGWIDSFTGAPIPADTMQRLVDATAARIVATSPRRVLEIGSGTGMVALRVAPLCERYVATDIAARGLEHIRVEAERLGCGAIVRVEQRSAIDLDGLGGPFDTVVVNATAQYFPSVAYLAEVVRRATRLLEDGGTLFLGELRSLPLVPLQRAAVVVARAHEGESNELLRARWQKAIASEKELALDPTIGHALARTLPEITDARVILKRGAAKSELVDYRFDLVLTVRGKAQRAAAPDLAVWPDEGENLEALAGLARRGACIGRKRAPNARLDAPLRARMRLDESLGPPRAHAVDPERVFALGDDLAIHVGWSDASARGDIAFVMQRRDMPPASFDGIAEPPKHAALLPLERFANAPAKNAAAIAVTSSIEAAARAVDPRARCVEVAAFPRRADGTVDLDVLSELA